MWDNNTSQWENGSVKWNVDSKLSSSKPGQGISFNFFSKQAPKENENKQSLESDNKQKTELSEPSSAPKATTITADFPDINETLTKDHFPNKGLYHFSSEQKTDMENPGDNYQQFLQQITHIGKEWNQLDKEAQDKFEDDAKSKLKDMDYVPNLPEFKDQITLPSFSYGEPPLPPHLEHLEQASKNNNDGFSWSGSSNAKSSWGNSGKGFKRFDDFFDDFGPGPSRNRFGKDKRSRGFSKADNWSTKRLHPNRIFGRSKESSSDDDFEVDDDIEITDDLNFNEAMSEEVQNIVEDVLEGKASSREINNLSDSISNIVTKFAKKIISDQSPSKKSKGSRASNKSVPVVNIIYPGAGQIGISASFYNQPNMPPMGMPPMGMPPMGMPPMGMPSMGMPQMGMPPMGMPPMGMPPMGMPPMGMPSMGMPQMGMPSMGMPQMGMPSMGMPSMGMPQMGMPSMGMPPMGMPPTGTSPTGTPKKKRAARKAKK